ncbi:MAG: iron chelate uptake ABC transporter family permease subunit, partial [Clostridia bacterium]|nr:iron chelate uptake ABC transporter family permease subunit [Clostridia bacterium]
MQQAANTSTDIDISKIEKRPSKLKWTLMALFPLTLFVASLFLGRYAVTPSEVAAILGQKLFNLPLATTWTDSAEKVVISVRLPRAIMAALVGAGLSMSGAAFQGMFQNPLVSPFILGVSAGASFGAAVGLVLEWPALGIQGLAFVFGLLAVGIT